MTNPVRILLQLLVLVGCLLAHGVAHAAPYTVKFCLDLDTDWAASTVGAGDYWTTNTVRPARGIWWSLWEDSTPGRFLTGYAEIDGTDAGCKSFDVDSQYTYDVAVKSLLQTNGVTVDVRYGTTEPGSQDYRSLQANYQPTASTTVTYTFTTDMYYRWIAMSGWMFRNTDFGMCPTTFYIRPDMGSSSTPVPQDDGDVYGSATHKFLMAHEIAHAVANRIEGTDVGRSTNCSGWDMNPDPPENSCRAEVGSSAPKSMFSMEYQAMAAREGWADFVAAWVWNNPAQSDCTHGRWGTVSDFDLDDDDTTPSGFPPDTDDADNNFTGAVGWVSCEGIPITTATCTDWVVTCTSGGHVPLASYVTARDWVQDLTVAADPMGCTQASLTNRGSEGDWMRFFWDLRTDENVSIVALANLWNNMDMSTVDADDNNDAYGIVDCGSTSTTDDVTVRLSVAAANTICGGTPTDCVDEVNNQKNNGQDH